MPVPLLLCTREHLFGTVCFGRTSRTWRHEVQSWWMLRRGALPRHERRSDGHQNFLSVAGCCVGSPGHQHRSPRSDSGGPCGLRNLSLPREPDMHPGPGSPSPSSVWGPWPGDPVCCGCDEGRASVNHHCGLNPVAQDNRDLIVGPQPQASAIWPGPAGKASALTWGLPSSRSDGTRAGLVAPGPAWPKSLGAPGGRDGAGPPRSRCSQSEARGHAWGEVDSAPRGRLGVACVPPRPKDQSTHYSGRPAPRTGPRGHEVRWCLHGVRTRFRAVPNDTVKPCPHERVLWPLGRGPLSLLLRAQPCCYVCEGRLSHGLTCTPAVARPWYGPHHTAGTPASDSGGGLGSLSDTLPPSPQDL